jgi:hypothetical protein
VCKSQKNYFTQVDYDPAHIDTYHVCKPHGNDNGPFATCDLKTISSYDPITATSTATSLDATIDDCLGYFSTQGVIDVSFNNGKCDVVLSCSQSDGIKGVDCSTQKCPATDPAQCCKDIQGNYNGTMCRDGNVCSADQKCISFYVSNGKEGTAQFTCVPGDAKSTGKRYLTRAACLDDYCQPAGKEVCCAAGWTMKNGQCIKNDLEHPTCKFGNVPHGCGLCDGGGNNCTSGGSGYDTGYAGAGPGWDGRCWASGLFSLDCHIRARTGGLLTDPTKDIPNTHCICNPATGKWQKYDNTFVTGEVNGTGTGNDMCKPNDPDNECGGRQ